MSGKNFNAQTGYSLRYVFVVILGVSLLCPLVYGLCANLAFTEMSFAKAIDITGKVAPWFIDTLGIAWILFTLLSTLVFVVVLSLSQHTKERLRAKWGLGTVTVISMGVLAAFLNLSGYSLFQSIGWGSGNVFLDALTAIALALFMMVIIVMVFAGCNKLLRKNKIGGVLKITTPEGQEIKSSEFNVNADSVEQLINKINDEINTTISNNNSNKNHVIMINGKAVKELKETDIKRDETNKIEVIFRKQMESSNEF